MAKLSNESSLYNELSQKYDEKKGDITLELFKECISIAKKATSIEMKFILFKLKSLYGNRDSGINKINIISKVTKDLVGDNYKASFMIFVLETALEEKNRD